MVKCWPDLTDLLSDNFGYTVGYIIVNADHAGFILERLKSFLIRFDCYKLFTIASVFVNPLLSLAKPLVRENRKMILLSNGK